jgi:hypothetical protein
MIILKFGEEKYNIKNKTNELTIGEFEEICFILNSDSLSKIDKWSKIFVFLGVPQEIIDEFDSFDFIEMIKEFKIFDEQNNEYVKEINLQDKVYNLYDEKFKLTVKENALIEEFVQKNNERYIAEIMAVLYKLEGTDKTIWYDTTHIKYKAKLFRDNVTIDKAMPIITYLTKKLVTETDLLFNDTTV